MLNSLRNGVRTAVVAMTPFLLTACGDDNSNNKKVAMSLLLAALAFCVVSFAANIRRTHTIG
jgi:hypothetical protein